jgi:beta-carotene/zeaxanthin 4-ketolase
MTHSVLISLSKKNVYFDLPLSEALKFHNTDFLQKVSLKVEDLKGVVIAFSIICLWLLSLTFFLTSNIANAYPLLILPAVLWQTFFYTGLFITAHDAMHGVIYSKNHRVNHFIGALAVFLYGFFSYRDLLKKHWRHHHHPATQNDPDYHNGKHANFLAWYVHFMKNYWHWFQLFCAIVTYHILHSFLHLSSDNLTMFWIIPSLLSSVQLFFFGTYLTHQEPLEGYGNPHRANTIAFPIWLSFLTCYHFGYHVEHHQFPHLPWWRLPDVHRDGSIEQCEYSDAQV